MGVWLAVDRARAARSPRGVREGTPGLSAPSGGRGVAVTVPPAGPQAPGWLGLRRGRRVRTWLRQPSRLPSTRASRADHRPTRQRPTVCQGRLDVAG